MGVKNLELRQARHRDFGDGGENGGSLVRMKELPVMCDGAIPTLVIIRAEHPSRMASEKKSYEDRKAFGWHWRLSARYWVV